MHVISSLCLFAILILLFLLYTCSSFILVVVVIPTALILLCLSHCNEDAVGLLEHNGKRAASDAYFLTFP